MGSGGAAQLLRYIGRTTFATYGVFNLCCFHDLKNKYILMKLYGRTPFWPRLIWIGLQRWHRETPTIVIVI